MIMRAECDVVIFQRCKYNGVIGSVSLVGIGLTHHGSIAADSASECLGYLMGQGIVCGIAAEQPIASEHQVQVSEVPDVPIIGSQGGKRVFMPCLLIECSIGFLQHSLDQRVDFL